MSPTHRQPPNECATKARARRGVPLALAGTLLLAALGVAAAPEDDYRNGVAAYRRGDVIGAMSALRPAANAGHVGAQVHLAFILESADFAEEAARLYTAAAAQGSAEGHAGLAGLLLTGRGIAKDEKRALQHFSKAAEAGHALSIEVVATAYLNGQMGLADAPPAEALAALRRAAGAGHLASIDGLAAASRQGRFGLPVDPVAAAQWERRAAELRVARAAVSPASAASAAARTVASGTAPSR